MFDTLKKIFLSFILPEDEREGKAKEVMVEVKQMPEGQVSGISLSNSFEEER